MSDTPNFLSKIISGTTSAPSYTLDDIEQIMMDRVCDAYGLDSTDAHNPQYRYSNIPNQFKDKVDEVDYYMPATETAANLLSSEEHPEDFLSTQRLRTLLREWINENQPKLLAPQYSALKPSVENIERIENDIEETLCDYVDFRMIKNVKKPTLNEVKDVLNSSWNAVLTKLTEHSKGARLP